MSEEGESSDEFYQEEEEDLGQNKLESSFMDNCKEDKNAQSDLLTLFQQQKIYNIETMFILFSFYQEEIASFGLDYNCKTKISLNKIRIVSQTSAEEAKLCLQKICSYIDKIVIVPLQHKNKIKIISSPYFNKKVEEKGFKLCKFNNCIYCHTNKKNISQKELKRTIKDLFSGQNIFVVNIKSTKSKEKQIYNHYRYFIKKMKQYHKQEFQSRDVIVQIDFAELNLNCIGTKERDLVAVKNIFKNLLQSTVILIARYSNQQGLDDRIQFLKKYSKDISKFPICVAKVEKRSLTIISKQNVIRKFIQKPKVLEALKLNDKTQLGMFLPRRYNYNERKFIIEQICTKRGYDFTTLGGIYHFFKKMFIHEDEEADPKEILLLLNQVLTSIKQNKDKFDIPSKFNKVKEQMKELEVIDGEYYSNGLMEMDEKLSKLLRRDVLKENVKMSKPNLVRYRVCQGEQSAEIYWYENDKKQKIICKAEQMKPGIDYFSGKIKKQGSQEHYFFESRIKIL